MTATVKDIAVWLATPLILLACNLAFAAMPAGLMIVGYDGDGWYPYISRSGSNSWMKLADIRDPANLTRQAGYYHLARLDLNSGEITWLTDGRVTDSFPSIALDGSLYFIRRTASGSRLMKLAKQSVMGRTVAPEAELETIELPDELTKIRYLELNNQ